MRHLGTILVPDVEGLLYNGAFTDALGRHTIGGALYTDYGTNHSFYNVPTIQFMCFLITVVMGLLMVSNIRYHSFKEFDLKNRIPFVTFLIIVPVFFLIAVETALVLFLLAMIYAVSGPVMTLILLRKHRVARKDAR